MPAERERERQGSSSPKKKRVLPGMYGMPNEETIFHAYDAERTKREHLEKRVFWQFQEASAQQQAIQVLQEQVARLEGQQSAIRGQTGLISEMLQRVETLGAQDEALTLSLMGISQCMCYGDRANSKENRRKILIDYLYPLVKLDTRIEEIYSDLYYERGFKTRPILPPSQPIAPLPASFHSGPYHAAPPAPFPAPLMPPTPEQREQERLLQAKADAARERVLEEEKLQRENRAAEPSFVDRVQAQEKGYEPKTDPSGAPEDSPNARLRGMDVRVERIAQVTGSYLGDQLFVSVRYDTEGEHVALMPVRCTKPALAISDHSGPVDSFCCDVNEVVVLDSLPPRNPGILPAVKCELWRSGPARVLLGTASVSFGDSGMLKPSYPWPVHRSSSDVIATLYLTITSRPPTAQLPAEIVAKRLASGKTPPPPRPPVEDIPSNLASRPSDAGSQARARVSDAGSLARARPSDVSSVGRARASDAGATVAARASDAGVKSPGSVGTGGHRPSVHFAASARGSEVDMSGALSAMPVSDASFHETALAPVRDGEALGIAKRQSGGQADLVAASQSKRSGGSFRFHRELTGLQVRITKIIKLPIKEPHNIFAKCKFSWETDGEIKSLKRVTPSRPASKTKDGEWECTMKQVIKMEELKKERLDSAPSVVLEVFKVPLDVDDPSAASRHAGLVGRAEMILDDPKVLFHKEWFLMDDYKQRRGTAVAKLVSMPTPEIPVTESGEVPSGESKAQAPQAAASSLPPPQPSPKSGEGSSPPRSPPLSPQTAQDMGRRPTLDVHPELTGMKLKIYSIGRIIKSEKAKSVKFMAKYGWEKSSEVEGQADRASKEAKALTSKDEDARDPIEPSSAHSAPIPRPQGSYLGGEIKQALTLSKPNATASKPVVQVKVEDQSGKRLGICTIDLGSDKSQKRSDWAIMDKSEFVGELSVKLEPVPPTADIPKMARN